MQNSFSYYALYKPFGMLSQFTVEGNRSSLIDLDFTFSKEVYPVGRLDADSEGLLLLTSERSLTSTILDPQHGHEREYWVQVEGVATDEILSRLAAPLHLRIDGKTHVTLPCVVKRIQAPPLLPVRNPPVRFRKSVPDEWISIALSEGKNRQVRRMTAAVGLPTLRLIRYRIGKLTLSDWMPGQVTPLKRAQFMQSIS